MATLDYFLNPQSIAVIGASPQEGKVGHSVVNNIRKSGFKGKVFPINPKAPEILGYQGFKSVMDVPENVQVAVLVIPAKLVCSAAEECGKKKVQGLVVITAGFKEVGGEGVELEHKLIKIGKQYNMRIVGPNVLGNITPHINYSFSTNSPPKGSIAFFSQSGAFLTAILDWANKNGLGFSNFVSLGNKCDVHEVDFIRLAIDDPNTTVVLLYLESIVDGDEFMRIVPACVAKKPIIILKSGTSAAGAAAASSHTGALAGNDIAFDLAFNKCGVIRAQTMSELFDLARLFTSKTFPTSDQFCIVTNAGGPGIVSTDAFETYGLGLAHLSEDTKSKLRGVLPAEASVKNPVDLVGDAPPKRYGDAIDIIFGGEPDEKCGGALLLVTPQVQTDVDNVARLCATVKAKYPSKFLVTAFMGGMSMDSPKRILEENGIPSYPFPEPAIAATKALIDYSRIRGDTTRNLCHKKVERFSFDNDKIRAIFAAARAEGRTVLLSHETSEVFTLMGVSLPRTKLAKTAADARKSAAELGFPIVMKIVSAQIMHKSDCGGVKLNIKTADEAAAAFDEIMANARKNGPKGAVLEGVECQQMVDFKKYSKTTEMIVGMSKDPTWGPMIMVGQGGIYANYIKDVAFEIAHKYDKQDALAQLKRTKIFGILEGVRGQPRSDVDGLVLTMTKLAQLVNDFPEINELDMNPLLVFEEQKDGSSGLSAVDVKITLK